MYAYQEATLDVRPCQDGTVAHFVTYEKLILIILVRKF
jgi:hypothetical protein